MGRMNLLGQGSDWGPWPRLCVVQMLFAMGEEGSGAWRSMGAPPQRREGQDKTGGGTEGLAGQTGEGWWGGVVLTSVGKYQKRAGTARGY